MSTKVYHLAEPDTDGRMSLCGRVMPPTPGQRGGAAPTRAQWGHSADYLLATAGVCKRCQLRACQLLARIAETRLTWERSQTNRLTPLCRASAVMRQARHERAVERLVALRASRGAEPGPAAQEAAMSGPSTDQRLRQAERLGELTDHDRARLGDRAAAARLVAAAVAERLTAHEAAAVVHPGLCGYPEGYGTDPAGDLLAGPLAAAGLAAVPGETAGDLAVLARLHLRALCEARVVAELAPGTALLVLGRPGYLRVTGRRVLPRGVAAAARATSGDEDARGELAVAWLGVLSPESRARLAARGAAREAQRRRRAEEEARQAEGVRAARAALIAADEAELERLAAALWRGRRGDRAAWARAEGERDLAGRWEPIGLEALPCCARVRAPSCAWPYTRLRHASSRGHCEALVRATCAAARAGELAVPPRWALWLLAT